MSGCRKSFLSLVLFMFWFICVEQIDRVSSDDVTRFKVGDSDFCISTRNSTPMSSFETVLDKWINFDQIEEYTETGDAKHEIKQKGFFRWSRNETVDLIWTGPSIFSLQFRSNAQILFTNFESEQFVLQKTKGHLKECSKYLWVRPYDSYQTTWWQIV